MKALHKAQNITAAIVVMSLTLALTIASVWMASEIVWIVFMYTGWWILLVIPIAWVVYSFKGLHDRKEGPFQY